MTTPVRTPTIPAPAPLPTGRVLAVYNGGRWAAFQTAAVATRLRRLGLSAIMLHGGPQSLLNAAFLPFVAWLEATMKLPLWLGCGLDYWTSYLVSHPGDEAVVQSELERVAKLAARIGAAVAVADSEGAAEAHPDAGRIIARLFLAAFAKYAPDVTLALTASDDPCAIPDKDAPGGSWGGHAAFPYKAWCTGPTRVRLFLPMRYVTSGHQAAKGALQHRIARSIKSCAVAVGKGWIEPSVVIAPYFQIHHTLTEDIVACSKSEPLVCFWALGTDGSDETLDLQGEAALVALAKP